MKFRLSLSIVLLLFVVIFTLQNTEVVTIKFLIWEFALSRALMIFLLLGIGILVGSFMGGYKPKSLTNKKHDQDRQDMDQ